MKTTSSLLLYISFFITSLYGQNEITIEDSYFDKIGEKAKLDPKGAQSILDSLKTAITSDRYKGQLLLAESDLLLRTLDSIRGIPLAAQALAIFEEQENIEWIAKHNDVLMFYYKSRSLYSDALQMAFSSIEIWEELGNDVRLGKTYSQVSDIYWYMSRFGDGINYGNRAVDVLKPLGPSTDLAFAYQMLSDCYLQMPDYTNALENIEVAIDMQEQLGSTPFELTSAINARANVNKFMGRYEEAINDYESNLKIHKEKQYDLGIRVAEANLGHVYLLTGQYEKAIPFKLSSLEYQMKTNDNKQMPENVKHLAESYAGIGDFSTAYEYMIMLDSLTWLDHEQSLNDQISELSIRYETDKKEQAINSLNERVKLQNLSMGLGGLLLLISVMGVLFFRKLNGQLKTKNKQNEVLLKEIHHRVKNNLQILSSLLSLQADHLVDNSAIDAITEGKNRVESMGLIHQRLYSNDDITTVNMSSYVEELSRHLEESYSSDQRRITIIEKINYGDMDVDFAIPLGLIINELVTNSIKYAFSKTSEGELNIALNEKDDKLVLIVADNGTSVTKSIDPKISTSFGTKLINSLCRKLKGDVVINNANGYSSTITFNRYKK